jgi:hypothetical protein
LNWPQCAPLLSQCSLGADAFKVEFLLLAVHAKLTIATEPISVVELRPPRTTIGARGIRYLPAFWKLARKRRRLTA